MDRDWPALQKHIQQISKCVETLLYAFAIDSTYNIQTIGNILSFPDTLLFNNLLVYILGSKNEQYIDFLHMDEQTQLSFVVLRYGNVRERMKLFTHILKCRNKSTF